MKNYMRMFIVRNIASRVYYSSHNPWPFNEASRVFELVGGKINLSDFPDDYFVRRWESRVVDQLNRYRFASSRLDLAKQTMLILEDVEINPKNSVLMQAIATAATGHYFSCFQQGDLSPFLKPRRVFKGNDVALAWHAYWKKIRDKRFSHPARVGYSLETFLVINPEGHVEATRSIKMDVVVGLEYEEMNSLFRIIVLAKDHVDHEIENKEAYVRREANKMSHEDLRSLPEARIDRPETY